MSDAQYHGDEEMYHDYTTRDANDDDSGPTYKEMLARNAENMDREYADYGRRRTAEDIEAALVAEAEEGYDVEKLKPRLTFDARVRDFWLLAEPAYQRFDELTKARINRALEVFKEDYNG